jgi:hypothetical protein
MPDGTVAGSAHPGPIGHDEWHELSIASSLDRDLPDDERAAAERLVATCAACARLHADLVALAVATRAMVVPPRPRDFALTADDAAPLLATGTRVREPHGAATRLSGEMQVPNTDHQIHDRLLVASLLDRATDDPERARAEALVAACADCAALHADLVALREATVVMPTPARRRDFAITPDDARRLQRTGWRRLIAVFGSARDAVSRPLAIGLTTIGLAGLLVTTVPWSFPGSGSAAAPATLQQTTGDAGSGTNAESLGGPKEAPAASAAPSAPGPAAAAMPAATAAPTVVTAPAAPSAEPAPSAEAFDTYVGAAGASPAAGIARAPADSTQGRDAGRVSTTSIGQDTASVDRVAAVTLAGLLFAAGLGLFVLRWAGRRV